MFAAASPIYIDSSKISPGTLEAIGRAAYINQKVNGFLPYLLGWVARFLQTYDGALRLTRSLVVRAPLLALFVWSSSTDLL